jgi:hypothetical protein
VIRRQSAYTEWREGLYCAGVIVASVRRADKDYHTYQGSCYEEQDQAE